MKVLIYGRKQNEAEPLAKKIGFDLVRQNPDFVLSYGGDGTLMKAEHSFPGVPKVILRGGSVGKKASYLSNEQVLALFKKGDYKIKEFLKLSVTAKNKEMTALNDVTVHNQDPRHAIRYRIWTDDNPIEHEIIGDGIVVATPFGSTGYYRSITGSFFDLGLGLAFNNSTEPVDHMILAESGEIKIRITRGPAAVYADNQEEYILLNDGEETIVKKSAGKAKILVFEQGP
ncbi:MAG: hypothetical protein UY23_C0001G0307 [Candidatus Jorgensenbacteria bacterium GW2011_GWA1_48_11]|uniref:Inorganic polyphosphate/ATP-NAD kinase n=1 Tax=Candidatus Jorgensenbacteria bacterium GW2011_GWA1_48_11 TaxID=1618660 RepID=A0A0G1UC21_9BACT|nr:MAG: hypothetical protein UY23_C0001G0307 [Candidatus Jorgensenbacteria bacterium GW2011_GWA1_48_11]KKW12192.1 MAG: hypothetical protein UY51_C0005G0434 [Candidatus Jorgensenbacteria bacterium GW2011_GWB1_49_9]